MIPRAMLLATRNVGKLREMRLILDPLNARLLDLDEAGIPPHADEEGLEQFETFEENAVAKGRYFFAASGLPTVADDSGLVIPALGGRPGVHSKRWSGRPELSGQALDDANNARLVASLAGISDRRAAYVCVAVFVDGARTVVTRGETDGTIVDSPSGTRGFGYDPYFRSTELRGTFSECADVEKARVSHRGRALRALVRELTQSG